MRISLLGEGVWRSALTHLRENVLHDGEGLGVAPVLHQRDGAVQAIEDRTRDGDDLPLPLRRFAECVRPSPSCRTFSRRWVSADLQTPSPKREMR